RCIYSTLFLSQSYTTTRHLHSFPTRRSSDLELLLSHRDQFVETVVEKLLTYALGRGLEYYDQPAVRAITREAAQHDYRISSVIVAITRSTPFQMRRSQDP